MTPASSSNIPNDLPSYDWVRTIKPELKDLDAIPLTGFFITFPWEEFSLNLARIFEREGLTIQRGEISWKAKEELLDGLGDKPFPLTFSIPSLKGYVYWVIPSQEIPMLTALLLTKEHKPTALDNDALNESFYHFFVLELLYQFTEVFPDSTLTPILIDQKRLPDQDSLCLEISFTLRNHTLGGRLILSPEFRRSWVEHFAHKNQQPHFSEEMAQLVDTAIHLEVGMTQLTFAEWTQVKMGDFIVLDGCSFDPDTQNGRLLLTINGKQIFRAKYKEGMLKILELPPMREAETFMAKQTNDPDGLEDFESSENDESEFDEDDDDEFFSDTDDDLFSEEEDESEEESEDIDTDEEEKIDQAENELPLKASEEESSPEIKPIDPKDIPMTLIVEIGQVHLSMSKLMMLEPGNLLETDIRPRDGVNLTVNGKVVGKGELIRIGEFLGVRITATGNS